MPTLISPEERKINNAISEEFRVLKHRRNWNNKSIIALFRKRGILASNERVRRLLEGQARMSVPELLILENEGLSISSVKELLQKKPPVKVASDSRS